MNVKNVIGLATLLVVGPTSAALAQQGLFHTPAEVAVWQQRMAAGPYKTAGDVATSSPGDWDRILLQANAFRQNPSQDRVTWPTDTLIGTGSYEPRSNHHGLRDAAFVYLLTGDVVYADAVRGELLAQAAEPSANFTDTTIWPTTGLDGNPFFDIAGWLIRLLYAYDLVEHTFSASEQAQMKTWFLNGAAMYRQFQDNVRIIQLWPNRDPLSYENGDYTPSSTAETLGSYTHDGGYRNRKANYWYQNRAAAEVTYYGLTGLKFGDATLLGSAKTWFKEWLAFGIYPSGLPAEFHRTYDAPTRPEAGYGYSSLTADGMLLLADATARAGDTELYDFTTADGFAESVGGSKNLLLVLKTLCDLLYDVYYDPPTDAYAIYSGPSHDLSTKMDGRDVDAGTTFARPIWFGQANLYYKDTVVEATYIALMEENIQLANVGGIEPYSGAWGALPGTLFMFGNLEGIVWPYASEAGSVVGAVADAYVRNGSYASTNYGTEVELLSKTQGDGLDREIYIKVDLGTLGSSISSATLRFYGNLHSTTNPSVTFAAYGVSDTSWTETGIVWNTAPVAGTTALDTVSVVGTTPTWYELDVTSHIAAVKSSGQTYAALKIAAVETSGSMAVFNSREAGTNQPELVVTATNSVPAISTTTLPDGYEAVAYSETLAATGGDGSLMWSLDSGSLPAGLSLSAGGIISGTPTAAGTSNFMVRVADGDGITGANDEDTQALSITIAANTVPSIATTSLPEATVATAYNETLLATGGDGTLTWSVDSGSLPAGLSLSPGGTISGTPTETGTSNFTVRVADSDPITGATDEDTQALSITVAAGSVTTTVGAAGDAYVRNGTYATTNYGTELELLSKTQGSGLDRQIFIKFDISALGSSVSEATLRLYGNLHNSTDPSVSFSVYDVSNTSWSETGITWNTAPSAGTTALDTVTVVGTTPGWYEFDVTSHIAAAKSAGHTHAALKIAAIETSGSMADFNSREAGADRPELVVTTGAGGSLPSPWQNQDIGAVGAAGSSSHTSGTFTVAGSGADIFGTSDEFQFTYQTMSGDGEIVARVASMENTDANAKVGVMIRESLAADAKHAFMMLKPLGTLFLRRTTTGGSTTYNAGPQVAAPYWVRLVRSADTFTASVSSDGSSWTVVGSPIAITMTSEVKFGLAVSSVEDGVLNTATFDNVTVVP